MRLRIRSLGGPRTTLLRTFRNARDLRFEVGGRTSGVINSDLIRSVLRAIAWVIAVYFLWKIARDPEIGSLYGITLALLGVVFVHFATTTERRFYAPIFFSFYYIFGFLASLSVALSKIGELKSDGHGGYGSFRFSNIDFFGFTLTAVIGVSGLMVGAALMERLRVHKQSIAFEGARTQSISQYIWTWITLSGIIIVGMWLLGIGQSGLTSRTQLPRGMASLLVFMKNILSPCIGLYLLELSLALGDRRKVNTMLFAIMALGAIGTLGGLSRGYLVMTLGVALAFILLRGNSLIKWRATLMRYGIICVVSLPVITFSVNELRMVGYSRGTTKDLGIGDASQVLGNFDLNDAIEQVLVLATERIGGARELMASQSSNLSDITLPFAILFSDEEKMVLLHQSVFGFLPNEGADTAFGVEFGLFGMLNLSGKYWIVFVGAMLGVMFVITVECAFLSIGAQAVALYCAVYFCGTVWGNAYLSILLKSLGMLLVTYVAICRLDLALGVRKNRSGLGSGPALTANS